MILRLDLGIRFNQESVLRSGLAAPRSRTSATAAEETPAVRESLTTRISFVCNTDSNSFFFLEITVSFPLELHSEEFFPLGINIINPRLHKFICSLRNLIFF